MIESGIKAQSNVATQLLIIDPLPEDNVLNAAEVAPWVDQGWKVVDATPRVTEQGAKLLVTLYRENRAPIPHMVGGTAG